MYACVYIYIYMHIYICAYVYIYIYGVIVLFLLSTCNYRYMVYTLLRPLPVCHWLPCCRQRHLLGDLRAEQLDAEQRPGLGAAPRFSGNDTCGLLFRNVI